MIPLTQINYTANGNVSPCRFITPVTGSDTGGQLAIQAADATQLIIGVSYEATRYPPNSASDDGYVAIAGEMLMYHCAGMVCNLKLGGTVQPNDVLTANSDGTGTGIKLDYTSDSVQCAAALAIQGGVSGDFVEVYVLSPFFHRTVHA